jgi:hypothetical protein
MSTDYLEGYRDGRNDALELDIVSRQGRLSYNDLPEIAEEVGRRKAAADEMDRARAVLLDAAHCVEMALLERFDDEDIVWAEWAIVRAAVDAAR